MYVSRLYILILCQYIFRYVYIYTCICYIYLYVVYFSDYIYINEKTYSKTFSDLNVFIAHDVVFVNTVYIYLCKAVTPCRISFSVYPVLKN